jgi:predicted AAA+ superfamily ATPase
MAKVIYRLWSDDNKDLFIMPGSLPLHDGSTRNELTYYLPAGWDAVVERDIDGERSETTELENKEPRFGQVGAARRVARTLFLGTAPSSAGTKVAIRGIDRARVVLGCLQPGQTSSVYSDALNRLSDRLHYLNSSGDKAQDATRFWFDTRANLRREMEDRKRRFDDNKEVRGKIADALKHGVGGATFFEGVHIFTPHGDVPDDSALRLVVLPPDKWYSREEGRLAFDAVLEVIRNNGPKPRHRWNRLLFLAADHGTLSRLNDAARVALAWASIVDDIKEGRLNIDLLQKRQAEKELQTAEEVLPRAARESYRWLLCPVQETPTESKLSVEAFSVNTAGGSVGREIERVCVDNELVITAWSPIHLKTKLKEIYWKGGKPATGAMAFWEDTLRYLYLPRLKDRDVLAQAIRSGAASRDFFGTAYGQHDGKFEGFQFGNGNIQIDDTLLLIEPEASATYEAQTRPAPSPTPSGPGLPPPPSTEVEPTKPPGKQTDARSFHGTAEIASATAKMRLVQIADEIVSVLGSDPNATVKVVVEISAEFPEGAKDTIKRAVSENARSLGLKSADWE